MFADVSLTAAVVAAGLWSGLLLTVTTILHPIYAAQDAAGFRAELGRFLPVARRSPTNFILVIALVVAPAASIVALLQQDDHAAAIWTAVGLVFTIAGPLLVSNRLAEPNYDVILGWDPTAVPAGWLATRRRYFALNWLRAALTWLAFACFLVALWRRSA